MFLHKSYIGKNIFPEILAKMLSANQIAGVLNQLFLQNKSMKQPHFLHVDPNSQKLIENWSKFFGLGVVKNGWSQSGLWTPKLTVSQEWTDEINLFFACWYRFMQIKRWLKFFGVGLVKNECGQSSDVTLKLTYLNNELRE